MSFVDLSIEENVAAVIIRRPKVNALNEDLVDELEKRFRDLEEKSDVKAVLLTAEGSFFSFGLDIPEFLDYSKESFTQFMEKFTGLIRYLFLFPKPVVAALNGHTIAGGCMIALACDYRIMASEKAKISLNELTFGSTIFASGANILRYWVGAANTEHILFTGDMHTAEDAEKLGLIHEAVSKENLRDEGRRVAKDFASKDNRAFSRLKKLLRGQSIEQIEIFEQDSIAEFVDIWYSESTRRNLEQIKIRS